MKKGHQWNLQSVLPRCAPRDLSILWGGAGQGLLFAGRGDHPWSERLHSVNNEISALKLNQRGTHHVGPMLIQFQGPKLIIDRVLFFRNDSFYWIFSWNLTANTTKLHSLITLLKSAREQWWSVEKNLPWGSQCSRWVVCKCYMFS